MSRAVYRYQVEIDGHTQVSLTGDPVAVAALPRNAGVEFWAEHTEGATQVKRAFQVFGTGHPLPEGAQWRGTCQRTPHGLVWHLYELPEVQP